MRYEGPEFAVRDVPGGAGGGPAPPERPDDPHAVGLVVLLSTRDDRRPGWLLAGQALQRLLYAAARGVDAAFHTQPLELAIVRELIREEFTEGMYPQMLLRLGCGGQVTASPRRPVADTLRGEAA